MKRFIYPVAMMATFVFAFCTKENEKPGPLDDQYVTERAPCPIQFEAFSNVLRVYGTNTNIQAAGVCFNPNLGKMRGVENASSGNYIVDSDSFMQFQNTNGFDVSFKIQDGNGLVQGFTLPPGRILVVDPQPSCGIITFICP
jgi:hypothetical protein